MLDLMDTEQLFYRLLGVAAANVGATPICIVYLPAIAVFGVIGPGVASGK